MSVLVYLAKFKKGSEASFWCTFSARFSHKIILYLILNQWKKFQFHAFFPSQDTKQNVVLNSQTLRFIFDQPVKEWLTGRKRWEDKNTKN